MNPVVSSLAKHLDGWLYVGVAFCAAITASLGSDDAVKFLAPSTLFCGKTAARSIGAAYDDRAVIWSLRNAVMELEEKLKADEERIKTLEADNSRPR